MSDPIDTLRCERDGALLRLTLNQPDKHNAISFEMWQGIAAALAEAGGDEQVRVVVLRGAGGRAFSAGADISQFGERRSGREAVAEYNAAVSQAYQAVLECPKPVLACIEGYCLGGGLGLALCCDLRYAATDARFAIPAARLGLGYSYQGLRLLVGLVGPSRAKEILFTARRYRADEALAMGLVNRLYPPAELAAAVDEQAATIAGNAPLTVRGVKLTVAEILRDPGVADLALCQRLVDECYASEDYAEGRRAFAEKRPPRFRGR